MRFERLGRWVFGSMCVLLGYQEAMCADSEKKAVRMDDVVVTAGRREMPMADTPEIIQVVDRKAIEEINPSKTGELLEYLTGAAVETGTGV